MKLAALISLLAQIDAGDYLNETRLCSLRSEQPSSETFSVNMDH